MTNKEKLSCLMAKDNFEEWSQLLESDKVRKFISYLNVDEIDELDIRFIRECIKDGVLLSNIKLMLPLHPSSRKVIKKAFMQYKSGETVIALINSGLEDYKIEKICEIIEGKDITQELITLLKKDFVDYQVWHICYGVNVGLTMQQIKVYAKENYGKLLMLTLRELLQQGYPINKVKLIANPKLTAYPFLELVELIKKGMSYSKLKVCVKAAYNDDVLEAIIKCFESGMKIKDVEEITHLSPEQIDAIRIGFNRRYPASYKEYCVKFDLDIYQFDALQSAYMYRIDESKIAKIVNPAYNASVMNMLINCVIKGISEEQFELLIGMIENEEKFIEVAIAVINGESEEEIKKLLECKLTNHEQNLCKLLET